MDKLQPIIKQRFWILLGLCLILALFGFFKTQSAIVAATTTREEALKATLAAIPTGNEANTTYVEHLKKINEDYKGKIDTTVDQLFADQQARMTWPDQIAKEIPKDPKGVPLYRDKEKVLSPVATRTYATIYKQLIEELWKKAEPVVEIAPPPTANVGGLPAQGRNNELLRGINSGQFRPRGTAKTRKFLTGQTILYDQPGYPKRTWPQKVYIDRQAVPQKVLPQFPSPEQVWDCQEDIWFTELIFEAVRKANKDAEDVLASPVRLISRIELRGGAGAEAAAGGGMEGMEGDMGMEMGMDAGMGGDPGMGADMGMGAMMAGAAGVLTPPLTEFDANEVFGPDVAAMAGGSMDGGMGDEMGGDASAMGMDMGMGMGMMGPPPTLRWVALADGAKFRERGFYLSVIINQQRIPDFLVYLCESAWPTKVLRFQMGPNPYRKDIPAAGGMGGMGGMGYDPYGGGAMGESMPMGGGNFGMASNYGVGGEAGMGMGMGMGGLGSAANRYPGGPPQFAFTNRDPFSGSLNAPDLVQLDIAGIITFYVSSEAAAETTADAAVDTPSAPGGEEELLKEAANEAAAKQDPAATPADGTAPAPAATPAAAGTEATPGATPPATEAPPATPDAAAPPSAEPPAATPPPAAPEN
ncbi:hypothetical protein Pan44_11490 [Caulifigura coniformis]|uniref:Uncharacterized protein n=1 Tax=Caulifigura coniformis TaxID=2527983 RepID=A0A517SAH6_9PLAN|nr:hypothetical protein [Caulifigura coniformis]QDT53134.1 hypothetical protein Pan44_11490 [Caulifigura coniformis]